MASQLSHLPRQAQLLRQIIQTAVVCPILPGASPQRRLRAHSEITQTRSWLKTDLSAGAEVPLTTRLWVSPLR